MIVWGCKDPHIPSVVGDLSGRPLHKDGHNRWTVHKGRTTACIKLSIKICYTGRAPRFSITLDTLHWNMTRCRLCGLSGQRCSSFLIPLRSKGP